MISAIVGIKTFAGKQSKIYSELEKLSPFVDEIIVAYGNPDIVVCLHAENNEKLYDFITNVIANIDGIISTDTRIIVPEEVIKKHIPKS